MASLKEEHRDEIAELDSKHSSAVDGKLIFCQLSQSTTFSRLIQLRHLLFPISYYSVQANFGLISKLKISQESNLGSSKGVQPQKVHGRFFCVSFKDIELKKKYGWRNALFYSVPHPVGEENSKPCQQNRIKVTLTPLPPGISIKLNLGLRLFQPK